LNGTQWVSQASPGNLTLRSASIAEGSGSIWIVGDNGTILKSSDGGWSKINSNTNATLPSVAMVNDSDGWIVGGEDNQGLILSGWSKWTTISFRGNVTDHDTVNATLNSLSMATADSALTVGTGGWSLYWNGSYRAGQTGTIAVTPRGVNMPVNVTNAGWTVGDAGTMLQWNGIGWSTLPLTNIPEIPVTILIAPFVVALLIIVPVLASKTKKLNHASNK
jgi:hypothetical protein